MAVSQFTIYTSSDPYGPGLLTGLTGSLLTVLDACLVNGYGVGQYTKVAAGWTKPLSNVSSSLGCWKQASGSKMTLFVNDAGPNVTSTSKEAWATGWEFMTNLAPSGSVFTASNSAGNGYGQFPLPSQLLTYGHVVWRKSTAADSTGRTWILIADAYTMYLWIQTGDAVNTYYHCGFGDFYSFGGVNDLWRCFIYGRISENSSGGANSLDWTDLIMLGGQRDQANSLSQAHPGHFIARNQSGFGGSQPFCKKGDAGFGIQSPINTNIAASSPIAGNLAIPNGTDNSIYLSPIWLVDPQTITLRGRFRGLYQPCHFPSNFSDGQFIQGSNDFVGKSFIIIKYGESGSSFWAVETSPTVDTN